MECLNVTCKAMSHVVCLAKCFLEKGEYVPIQGKCPNCFSVFLWGDLVKKYNGCYGNLDVTLNCSDYSDVDFD